MCAVCIFHAWYKAKSDACGKPRLIQDTLFHTLESHNMRHLPLYWSSSTDTEVGIIDSRNRVAAGASGFVGFPNAALSSWRWRWLSLEQL